MSERFARLRPVTAHIHHRLGRARVLLEQQAIGDILQIRERLALAADQAALEDIQNVVRKKLAWRRQTRGAGRPGRARNQF